MADEAEDVLELENEDVIEDEDTDATPPDADGDEPEGDEETFIGFDGEEEDEAAPASESESSVIREMRRKLRETERELQNYRKGTQPAKIELGPKPTLESCDYDEEAFEAKLDDWKARKSKADAQEAEAREAEERQRAEWTERADAYKAHKTALGVSGYDEAEAEVFSVLPQELQAAILFEPKTAPALIYALSRNPAKLEELSKLNLFQAAKMLGKLEDKVKVEKRRKLPNPDKPLVGAASVSGGDKELKRLEREAERTGDRTALIRYRKQLNA